MYFSGSWHSEAGVPLTEGEQRVEEIIRNHEAESDLPSIYSEVSLSDQDKDI
jgi:hypothetical protein